jgi:Ser/Thr protein kinase RdoA (MazF antagonist)
LIPAFGGSIPPAPANLSLHMKRMHQQNSTLGEDRLSLLELARTSLGAFGLERAERVELVNHSENATYRVRMGDGPDYALRIHREGYHDHAAITSELAWMIALREARVVTVPEPVRGMNGGHIQRVTHPRLGWSRHVVITKWEAGVEPSLDGDLRKPFIALGEAAARMHLHAVGWRRPPGFTRLTWNFETALGEENPHWGRWRDGMGVTRAMQKVFGRAAQVIQARLSAYGQSSQRFGLVHGDMRLANLLLDAGEVKVIDFDDCGISWFMYDAATPVSFFEHEDKVPELLAHWLDGYRNVRALDRADEDELPTFVMLRRLLLVAWIGTRRETDLARTMGVAYSEGTTALCDRYLSRFT